MIVEILFEIPPAADAVVWKVACDAVLSVEAYGPPQVTVIEEDGTRRAVLAPEYATPCPHGYYNYCAACAEGQS